MESVETVLRLLLNFNNIIHVHRYINIFTRISMKVDRFGCWVKAAWERELLKHAYTPLVVLYRLANSSRGTIPSQSICRIDAFQRRVQFAWQI